MDLRSKMSHNVLFGLILLTCSHIIFVNCTEFEVGGCMDGCVVQNSQHLYNNQFASNNRFKLDLFLGSGNVVSLVNTGQGRFLGWKLVLSQRDVPSPKHSVECIFSLGPRSLLTDLSSYPLGAAILFGMGIIDGWIGYAFKRAVIVAGTVSAAMFLLIMICARIKRLIGSWRNYVV